MPPNYHPPVAPSTSTLPMPPNYVATAPSVPGPGGLPMPPNYVPSGNSLPQVAPIRGPNGFPMPPGYRPAAPSTAVLTPPTQAPSGSNAIITAEAPVKLDIPSNNRIFVDGKAHEVEYVNDIAVIERNGLPHKRYESVVDALHEKQQNACPHCGQRMELRGERYERHLDWHVKRNLKTFEKTSSSRPWYASSKDWLKSEEEEETGVSVTSGSAETMEESVSIISVSAREAVNKNCAVCCEEFEEYCDEDDDGVWKLKDCVIVNNQYCFLVARGRVSYVSRKFGS
ncbi:hypothetical protein TELCIR_03888 [Teladorsagia circumcincta]|uniref:Uncharacterized protein n=1 Tax=Teladorsagia circumcincta TaxID=45464 RepID=A0A2G9UV35_TELCI|nr:hypothetical protein TELCIR_03888 [Teladorsagia circumcincta]